VIIKDAKGVEYYSYKQINALGDGPNLQEYYEDNRPSVRDMHFKIEEEDNNKVRSALEKDGWQMEEPVKKEVLDAMKSQQSVVSSSPMSIKFQEHPLSDYPSRTRENAKADVTIAIAKNFDTAGEKLTRNSVQQQGKKYMPVDHDTFASGNSVELEAAKIASEINKLPQYSITLNIAGNGIYTLFTAEDKAHGYTPEMIQNKLKENVKELLQSIQKRLVESKKIESVTTGGQTGYDEAGAKAAQELGIPVRVLAPKGWVYRDVTGKDIRSEEGFKKRFESQQPVVPSNLKEQNKADEWKPVECKGKK
jgi:hypothetical protein